MIDPKLRAQDVADDFLDVTTKASEIVFKLEDLIREAQEDGAAKYKAIALKYTSWISGELEEDIDESGADFLISKMDELILKLKKAAK